MPVTTPRGHAEHRAARFCTNSYNNETFALIRTCHNIESRRGFLAAPARRPSPQRLGIDSLWNKAEAAYLSLDLSPNTAIAAKLSFRAERGI